MLAPHIDPVALQIGPLPLVGTLSIHWYGLMYVFGFLAAWAILVHRGKDPRWNWSAGEVSDFLFYIALGVVLGGRIGYVLFYNFSYYLEHPLRVFAIWSGGMAFHGGLIGVIIAGWLFTRYHKRSFLASADFTVIAVPIGLGLGRLGNFINGELYGRVTDASWGMVFPNGGPLPRHPSQLYEAFLEGFVLLLILWLFSRKERPAGAVFGLFLAGYGSFRFFVEFFREPDPQLGFLFADATMGQLLSAPMIAVGLGLMLWAYRSKLAPALQK